MELRQEFLNVGKMTMNFCDYDVRTVGARSMMLSCDKPILFISTRLKPRHGKRVTFLGNRKSLLYCCS